VSRARQLCCTTMASAPPTDYNQQWLQHWQQGVEPGQVRVRLRASRTGGANACVAPCNASSSATNAALHPHVSHAQLWDAGGSSPQLLELLSSDQLDVRGKRTLVPGCGCVCVRVCACVCVYARGGGGGGRGAAGVLHATTWGP
jgi:hypothetical protein